MVYNKYLIFIPVYISILYILYVYNIYKKTITCIYLNLI